MLRLFRSTLAKVETPTQTDAADAPVAKPTGGVWQALTLRGSDARRRPRDHQAPRNTVIAGPGQFKIDEGAHLRSIPWIGDRLDQLGPSALSLDVTDSGITVRSGDTLLAQQDLKLPSGVKVTVLDDTDLVIETPMVHRNMFMGAMEATHLHIRPVELPNGDIDYSYAVGRQDGEKSTYTSTSTGDLPQLLRELLPAPTRLQFAPVVVDHVQAVFPNQDATMLLDGLVKDLVNWREDPNIPAEADALRVLHTKAVLRAALGLKADDWSEMRVSMGYGNDGGSALAYDGTIRIANNDGDILKVDLPQAKIL